MENKSYLDEGKMEKLEQMLKQTEQIANEAEAKYEEVKYDFNVNDLTDVIQTFSTIGQWQQDHLGNCC